MIIKLFGSSLLQMLKAYLRAFISKDNARLLVAWDNEHSYIHCRVEGYHDEEKADYSEKVLIVKLPDAVI